MYGMLVKVNLSEDAVISFEPDIPCSAPHIKFYVYIHSEDSVWLHYHRDNEIENPTIFSISSQIWLDQVHSVKMCKDDLGDWT